MGRSNFALLQVQGCLADCLLKSHSMLHNPTLNEISQILNQIPGGNPGRGAHCCQMLRLSSTTSRPYAWGPVWTYSPLKPSIPSQCQCSLSTGLLAAGDSVGVSPSTNHPNLFLSSNPTSSSSSTPARQLPSFPALKVGARSPPPQNPRWTLQGWTAAARNTWVLVSAPVLAPASSKYINKTKYRTEWNPCE